MKQKTDAQNEYITTTELAALCGVSRFTIINWTEQGVISCVKTVGGHRRILRSEALNVIESLKGNGTQSSRETKECVANTPPEPQPEVELPMEDEDDRATEDVAANDKQILKDVSYVMGRGLGGIKAGLSSLKSTLGGNARADLPLPQ